MESPIRSIRFIHNAIKADFQALEEATAELAPEDRLGAQNLAERMAFLYDAVKTHEDGEEATIFPLLDLDVYPVSAPYLLDHRVEQFHMRESLQAFERLASMQDMGERALVIRHLGRQAIVLNASTMLHIRKEEELLMPLIEEHISPEKQVEAVQGAVAHFQPQQLRVVLPWILRAQTADDQEVFVRDMMGIMPPQVFRLAMTWARDGLPAEDWSELTRRIPEAA